MHNYGRDYSIKTGFCTFSKDGMQIVSPEKLNDIQLSTRTPALSLLAITSLGIHLLIMLDTDFIKSIKRRGSLMHSIISFIPFTGEL